MLKKNKVKGNTIFQIILGGFIGTSLMTAFSYYLSNILDRQFKEPKLLYKLLKRSVLFKEKRVPPVSGWLIHYSVGIILIMVYHLVWSFTSLEPSLLTGGILGFFSGIVGIGGWSFVFHMHSNPPSVDLKKFYLQLSVAHVIFGIFGAAGYMII